MNKEVLTISGATRWHEKGYTGKGITIAVLDDFETPEIIKPYDSTLVSSHGLNVSKSALVTAPDANIIMLKWKGAGCDKTRCVTWIKENNPDLINVSQGGNIIQARDFPQFEGFPMFCASGNSAKDIPDYPARYDFTLAVGAWNHWLNKVASYSSRGEDIFGLNPYIPNARGEMWAPAGTSFACPFAVGLMACYLQLAKERGQTLTTEQIYEVTKANTNEYGLFVLPEQIPEKEGETLQLRQGQILFAVIHHSGVLREYTAEEVLRVHRARGFATYGYNKLVEPDGKVVLGRDPKYRGAHTYIEKAKTEEDRQYWNEHSLGYCFVWNGEEAPFPEIMYKAVAKELYKDGFTVAQIRLHGEVDATKCPGKYFDKAKLINYLEKEWEGAMAKTDYDNHWAKGDIDSVKKLGLMAGYDEQTFKPDQPVTRAELAAVINRLHNKLK